jgi:hypothetical protein
MKEPGRRPTTGANRDDRVSRSLTPARKDGVVGESRHEEDDEERDAVVCRREGVEPRQGVVVDESVDERPTVPSGEPERDVAAEGRAEDAERGPPDDGDSLVASTSGDEDTGEAHVRTRVRRRTTKTDGRRTGAGP